MPNLRGKTALVAGATRGAGRGIACALGEAGATVYCTGRSVRGKLASGKGRPETIEETADMVTAWGGKGIAVRVDHTVPEQVEKLLQRIRKERKKLHILVNDIWGGEQLVEFGKTFWKVSLEKGHAMLKTAVWSHIVSAHYSAPLLMKSAPGLIVGVTDGDFYGYRGNIFYDLVKTAVIRLAFIYSYELRKKNIASVAVTPGFLRSESMLEHFGVTEANWQEGAKKDPNFLFSETPLFVGRAIAHLAADPKVSKKSGRVFSSWNLSDEYGFSDADGRRPHWGRHFQETYGQPLNSCDDVFYSYWFKGAMELVFPDWP